LVQRLALETLFQPQRDPAARLDVLGLLEAEGGWWDAVWVLGLTDEALPAAPSPNPFIPLRVLREAGAPRATPERELAWASAMYGSLQACAPEVWLSHPELDGERELQPSPLMKSVPESVFELLPRRIEDGSLDRVLDDRGPALDPGQKTRGG